MGRNTKCILTQNEPVKKFKIDEIAAFAGTAFRDLDSTRTELKEKDKLLTNIATEYMAKIKELSKINHDLQDKVGFLLDISASLNKKNDELKKANQELETQKSHYDEMTKDLQTKLDQVLSKEKELSMQRDFLARQVDSKTQDLIKAEKFAVIGELAARLAHDLRNPLTILKSTIDIMRAKPSMQLLEKLQYFGRLDRAIQRMTHQIDDVLNFVKISELSLQKASLIGLIDGAITNTLVPEEVKILRPHTDVAISCDSRKLEAVFSNLISNSIQAMGDKGEIRIRINDLGNDVQIEVEDTGPGIPAEILPKIFDPLFTTKQTGTGLGLSICKNIVEQHGGRIMVKSPPTIFALRMPKNIAAKYEVKAPTVV